MAARHDQRGGRSAGGTTGAGRTSGATGTSGAAARSQAAGRGRAAGDRGARPGPDFGPGRDLAGQDLAHALVRVCDLAGRPRGTGFLADSYGTLVTSHEAVDGLARLVLHAPGDQVCLVEAAAVTALPASGLALVATEGLSVPPLPIAPGGPADPERRVRLHLPRAADGTVTGSCAVTYTATDRFHLLDEAYALDLGGLAPAPAAPHASGTPVTDAATGAVLGVVATALHAGQRASAFAIPLHAAAGQAAPPLAQALARNAACVPAYGPHLNLAGALRLTAVSAAGLSAAPAGGPHDRPGPPCEPVPRPALARALDAFAALPGDAAPLVLGLVGDPGTGRSTELDALAARRAGAPDPAPTLRLRGADLRPGDGSLADAAERALRAAARTVSAPASRAPVAPEPPYCSPDVLAGVARAAGRPLLVLLDSAEEMPPVLAHALPGWTAATAAWLRSTRTRLVLACRPELWDQAGPLFPSDLLHAPVQPSPSVAAPASGAPEGSSDVGLADGGFADHRLPRSAAPADAVDFADGGAPSLRIGDLTETEAERARRRYGLPEGAVADADAAHPLALRLLAGVLAALPEPPGAAVERVEIFSAHLDLVCLRVAGRLAAACDPPPRGTAVRRLAARVAGQVHEAARRCLGPGQGELDREAFEELFPWRTGWAAAVLAEGLLVPAGAGYRFADEGFSDWLQALHLDLDAALHALAHRWFAAPDAPSEAPVRLPSRPVARAGEPPAVPPAPAVGPPGYPRSLPVPRHRAGPVVQALLLAPPADRAARLLRLVEVLDRRGAPPTRCAPDPPAVLLPPRADSDADTVPTARRRRAARAVRAPFGLAARQDDAGWWAGHLLREVLLRLPDASSCREVLRELAGRIVVRSVASGGFDAAGLGGLGDFGPRFWLGVRCDTPTRLDLLRVLLPADPPPAPRRGPLPGPEAVPEEAASPRTGGGRPGGSRFLDAVDAIARREPAAARAALCGWLDDDRPLQTGPGGPRLTVACAAQALLFARRRPDEDGLVEALADVRGSAAGELLAALAEEEPAAMCRAVDRWAHDPRPQRRAAAVAHGPSAAAHARTGRDRELAALAALALLAEPGESRERGAALAMLVRDPLTRGRHLPTALRHFAAGRPGLPARALLPALSDHPESVLAAFRVRLREAGGDAARDLLGELAAVAPAPQARRVADLVRDHLGHRPEHAAAVARHLDVRLEQGPRARPVLLPLVEALWRDHPARVRRELAPVFAAPGTSRSRPLRQELLDAVLERERDPDVLHALLAEAAGGAARRHPLLTRDLVHRLAQLLGRTPEGAARFDRDLVELAAAAPHFARLMRRWLADGDIWDALVGPCARRSLDALDTVA